MDAPGLPDLASARDAAERGDLRAAEAICRAHLDLRPDAVTAINTLAFVRLHQARLGEAKTMIEASLEADPRQSEAWTNLATLRLATRERGVYAALTEAIRLAPDNIDAWTNLGFILTASGRHEDAAEAFRFALSVRPGLPRALIGLAQLHMACGRLEEAVSAFSAIAREGRPTWAGTSGAAYALALLGRSEEAAEQLRRFAGHFPDDPRPLHHLAALRAEAPPRPAPGYVARIFDDFAATFDQVLAELGYCGPDLVVEAAATALSGRTPRLVLDLGCGTGLSGAALARLGGAIIGIDVSGPMIRRAERRGVYARLVQADILDVLAGMPPGVADLVVAADSLNYLGDIAPALAGITRVLRPGGVAVATFETPDEDTARPWTLAVHGRFQHGAAYVERTTAEAGLVSAGLTRCVLRREMGQPVHCLVLTAFTQKHCAKAVGTNDVI